MKLDDIPITLYTRQYQGVGFEIGLTFFSPHTQTYSQISEREIITIIIDNDLECFNPSVIITYKDINHVFMNSQELVGQYARLVIKQPTYIDEKTVPKYFDFIVLITNSKIVDFNPKYSVYELHCEHSIVNLLNRHINYATSKELSDISPYQIITNVLNKVGFEVDEDKIAKTTQQIQFITSQDLTVKDIIQYCLAAGVSKNDKPAFFYFNNILNRPYVWNEDLDMKDENRYDANRNLGIMTSDGGDIKSSDLMVRDVVHSNSNPTTMFIQDSGLDITWNFDQTTRTWSQNIIIPNKIKENLSNVTKEEEDKAKSNFHVYSYNDYYIRHYHPNYDFLNLYSKYRDLYLGTNSLEIMVRGSIIREVGQTVELCCNDDNAMPLLGGIWRMYKVMHIFQANTYTNSLVLFRTKSIDIKPKEPEKK